MKPNTHLLGFGGLLAVLLASHFYVIVKYFELLIHSNIYYCQAVARTLSLQIPGDISRIYVGLLLVAVVYTFIKIGAALYKIYAFHKTILKTTIKKDNRITQIAYTVGLSNQVTILKQQKPQAFCFGVINPKIYLSTGLISLMSDVELKVILRHEKYHVDHNDPLVFILATLVESLFPFFPVISEFIRVYRTDREVKADNHAMRTIEDRYSLTEILKKLVSGETTVRPAFIASILSEDILEARIQSITQQKVVYQKARTRNVILSIASFIVLIGLMVSPVNAIELHDSGRDVVMLCDGTNNCESVCRQETLLKLQSHAPQYSPANFSSQF